MTPPAGTRIAWFAATGQFVTHQQASAAQTRNRMEYAVGNAGRFETIYVAEVPTYTQHWHYNAAREVALDALRMCCTCVTRENRHSTTSQSSAFSLHTPLPTLPLEVTHCWTEDGVPKQSHVTLSQPGGYEVTVSGETVNDSVEMAVLSVPQRDIHQRDTEDTEMQDRAPGTNLRIWHRHVVE